MKVNNELAVVGGQELEDLETCAAFVSSWLTVNKPNTKPKSINQLISGAETSLYAMDGSHTMGHVAVNQHGLHALCVGGGGREGLHYRDIPHFVVESLVVKPGSEGKGIGSLLLESAMKSIAQKTSTIQDGPFKVVAVASALACDASWPLFLKQGFNHIGSLGHDLEVVEPYAEMDMPMNRALGKTIVFKTVKAVAGFV